MDSNKNLLLEKANLVIKEAEKLGATQAQVTISLADTALTRLANSIIDQNVADRRSMVSIKFYFNQRRGTVAFEVFDDEALKEATAAAAKIAKVSPENKDFKSLPTPKPYSYTLKDAELVDMSTVKATPEKRAEYSETIITTAHNVDSRIRAVAGAISNSTVERVIVNSLGVEAYNAGTRANVTLTILAEDDKEESAGWCQDIRRGFSDLQIEKVSEIAATKAAEGFGMKILEPGDYEVVLEPAAVGGFGFFLGFYAFSARAYQDYLSFLRDRIGEKIFSEKYNLWDDSLDNRFARPTNFDAEGYPKSKLDLVEDGVVKNIVYDTLTASKDGVESTGHHASFFGRSAPIPTHQVIQEGSSSVEEMISETKNGLLVTHFHYQNAVDPTKGMYTGLTRDGAWYIKNGEIQYPVKTLRYTDAAPRFFGEIDLIGKYSDPRTSEAIVPPMKLPSFKITGSTKE
ncbi:MAG: TldD/PmbA family protein [Candidatus Thorarchaeota archaeon]|jgi:predicted Zn-dependent protease